MLTSLVCAQQENAEKSEKSIKIVDIEVKNLHSSEQLEEFP